MFTNRRGRLGLIERDRDLHHSAVLQGPGIDVRQLVLAHDRADARHLPRDCLIQDLHRRGVAQLQPRHVSLIDLGGRDHRGKVTHGEHRPTGDLTGVGQHFEHLALDGRLDLRLCQARAGKLDLAIKQVEIGIRVGELFVLELALLGCELLGDLERLDLQLASQVLGLGLEILDLGLETVRGRQGLVVCKLLVQALDQTRTAAWRRRPGVPNQAWPSGSGQTARAPAQASSS